MFRFRRRVELITDARQSPVENYEYRKKVYNILQGLRVPFLLAAALAYLVWHNVVLSGILMVICVPLPWVAVVIGNGIGEPHDARTKQVYKPQASRDAARAASAALTQQSSRGALPAASTDSPAKEHSVVDVYSGVEFDPREPWAGLVIDHDEEHAMSAHEAAAPNEVAAGVGDTQSRLGGSGSARTSAPTTPVEDPDGHLDAAQTRDVHMKSSGGIFT